MSRTGKRITRIKRWSMVLFAGTAFQFGACQLDEFNTTSVVTLNTRDVVNFLVQSWILTPIQNVIQNGVDNFFDDGEVAE